MNKRTDRDNRLKIIPLGGLEAVGKNITLFEYKNEIIIVDCGIIFPTMNMPGIDFVIPDFSYVTKNSKKIKAILITHGHEDHIGAIPFILKEINVPIYATRFTLGLIQSRLQERPPRKEPVFHEIKPRDRVDIGNFSIEFLRVNHSIADGVAMAIQTDLGTIIHTGDFKIDFTPTGGEVTDLKRFADYGEKGVLLLMSDSTNAEKEGFTKSEAIIDDKLIEIFSSSKGRIIAASFASNIYRIQQIIDAAQRFNRKVAISGISMEKNIEIAEKLGYLKIRDDLIVDINEANLLPKKKLVIIGTGSQGETMSALSRMANGTHRHFCAEEGDTVVITASVIPGNEKTVTYVVNALMKQGADVYYANEKDVHVSGHGSSKELKLMISLTKPRFFMPIHGEYKHLRAHANIAESMNIKASRVMIAENGSILELSKKSFRNIGQLSLSQIYIDGDEMGDVSGTVISDRLNMSTDGIVIINIVIAEGMLIRKPEVIIRGLVEEKNTKMSSILLKDVERRVGKMLRSNNTAKEIETGLKRSLKPLLYRHLRKKPVVIVSVMDI